MEPETPDPAEPWDELFWTQAFLAGVCTMTPADITMSPRTVGVVANFADCAHAALLQRRRAAKPCGPTPVPVPRPQSNLSVVPPQSQQEPDEGDED